MDTNRMDHYINKVIEDACRIEKRPNDVRWEYFIIDDILLFAMKSQYRRVRRRIEYRLQNNLEKNFGLKFNLVIPEPYRENDVCRKNVICDLYGGHDNGPCGLDPNHSFMTVIFFGKRYTVRSLYGIRPDEELGLKHLEKLKRFGFDYEHDGNWERFRTAYIKTYGEDPIEGFRKVKKYWESKKH